jgi:5-methylcytosine-specific restriction endonuclease McrA
MEAALERLVWERAHRCCEYCLMPQEYDELWFEIDHIIARKHGGPTVSANLALACFFCSTRSRAEGDRRTAR